MQLMNLIVIARHLTAVTRVYHRKGRKNADGADMLKVARRIGHFIN